MSFSYDITDNKYYEPVNVDVNLTLLNVIQLVWNTEKNYANSMSPKIFKKEDKNKIKSAFFSKIHILQCIVLPCL